MGCAELSMISAFGPELSILFQLFRIMFFPNYLFWFLVRCAPSWFLCLDWALSIGLRRLYHSWYITFHPYVLTIFILIEKLLLSLYRVCLYFLSKITGVSIYWHLSFASIKFPEAWPTTPLGPSRDSKINGTLSSDHYLTCYLLRTILLIPLLLYYIHIVKK